MELIERWEKFRADRREVVVLKGRKLSTRQRTIIESYISQHNESENGGVSLYAMPTEFSYALEIIEALRAGGMVGLTLEPLLGYMEKYREALWIVGMDQERPPTDHLLNGAFQAARIEVTCVCQNQMGVWLIIGAVPH